jgi:hypothetical protein
LRAAERRAAPTKHHRGQQRYALCVYHSTLHSILARARVLQTGAGAADGQRVPLQVASSIDPYGLPIITIVRYAIFVVWVGADGTRLGPWRGARTRVALVQQVASILTRLQVDVTSANQTNASSRLHICIMRCGSRSLKPAVKGANDHLRKTDVHTRNEQGDRAQGDRGGPQQAGPLRLRLTALFRRP